MEDWNARPPEIKYLLSPAFCGRILYSTIAEYGKKTNRPMPFPLIYLVLPLVLHKSTREKISSITKLTNWVQKNPELLIDFPKRAKDLIEFTNEGIELLLHTGVIRLTPAGELERVPEIRALSKAKAIDDEIKECIIKSENIARWFAAAGKAENVYVCLGVRP